MTTHPEGTFPLANRKQMLWFLGLIPFVVMHNISAVFIELRGVIPGQLGLVALGYFLGLASSALLLPVFEHNIAQRDARRKVWSIALLVVLLLPGLFSLIVPLVCEGAYSGNLFINTFQPFLWALFLPIAFQLFFHPILNGLHGVLFGIVTAVGHLCWALLLPIISISASKVHVFSITPENMYLPFLNTVRCIFGIAFALIAWQLSTYPRAPKVERANTHESAPLAFWPFLLVVALCFFLYGFISTALSEHLPLREVHLGYMHLGLALLFLLIGFWVTHRNAGILKKLIVAAFLGLATIPLLLYFVPYTPLSHALHYVYVTSYQVLLFAGTLVCGYFTLQSNRTRVSVALILSVLSSAILGRFLGSYLSPQWPFSPFALVCMSTVVHMALAPFARNVVLLLRLTPLPSGTSNNDRMTRHIEMMQNFSKIHQLKRREVQIMEMLLQGHSTAEIVELLGLKESTVRTYIQTLLRKTETTSRLGLVAAFLGSDKDGSQ